MYEYICDYERWKKFDKEYNEKYQRLLAFSQKCIETCKENQECINRCNRPIIDIERFNLKMIKKLSSDVYEICSSKLKLDSEQFFKEVEKMNICSQDLYKENESIVKSETLTRMSDMIKFLNI
jgi:hypothetical protein